MSRELDVAIFWDFDFTLTEEFMQQSVLDYYFGYGKLTAEQYFKEANERFPNKERPLSVMEAMIEDSKPGGPLEGLTNELLYEFGKKIKPAKGLQFFLPALEEKFKGKIKFHNYVLSLGFEPMIKGFLDANNLTEYFEVIQASSFSEDPETKVINGINNVVSEEGKMEYIQEIYLGNDLSTGNNIIISDSEEKLFRIGAIYGDLVICVYSPNNFRDYCRALDQQEKRVAPNATIPGADFALGRDYSPEATIFKTICERMEKIMGFYVNEEWMQREPLN